MKNSSFDKKACFTLKLISFFTTTVSVVMLIFIIGYVIFGGADKITLALLFGDGKQSPSVLPALAGTVRLIFIAIIIAVPLGESLRTITILPVLFASGFSSLCAAFPFPTNVSS